MDVQNAPDSSAFKIAVIIDATTYPVEVADVLFSILATYGEIVLKRAFANWSNPESRPWAERLAVYGITPVQKFEYPDDKSPDVDIAIEALDLAEQGFVNAFAIVSGSGALSRLATRLKEAGQVVLGFGSPPATSGPFRGSCSIFWTVEDLKTVRDEAESEEAEENESIGPVWSEEGEDQPLNAEASEEVLTRFKNVLKISVAENEGDDGWALLSSVGSSIKIHWPSFNANDLGYKSLKNLVENSKDIVRVNTIAPCRVRLLDDFS
ncbi:MAG: NYN domain-containing protein [Deltaproteobacteria bacterium]|jgi:hypothetical protein|nr:NYN domain-containing protein [Deltaproteobacteria bacterium]